MQTFLVVPTMLLMMAWMTDSSPQMEGFDFLLPFVRPWASIYRQAQMWNVLGMVYTAFMSELNEKATATLTFHRVVHSLRPCLPFDARVLADEVMHRLFFQGAVTLLSIGLVMTLQFAVCLRRCSGKHLHIVPCHMFTAINLNLLIWVGVWIFHVAEESRWPVLRGLQAMPLDNISVHVLACWLMSCQPIFGIQGCSTVKTGSRLVHVFASLRFTKDGSPMYQALALQKLLKRYNVLLHIVDAKLGQEGGIKQAVFKTIRQCKFFIGFGTAHYGISTGNPAATDRELAFWQCTMEAAHSCAEPLLLKMHSGTFKSFDVEVLFGCGRMFCEWPLDKVAKSADEVVVPDKVISNILDAVEVAGHAPGCPRGPGSSCHSACTCGRKAFHQKQRATSGGLARQKTLKTKLKTKAARGRFMSRLAQKRWS